MQELSEDIQDVIPHFEEILESQLLVRCAKYI